MNIKIMDLFIIENIETLQQITEFCSSPEVEVSLKSKKSLTKTLP